MNILAHWGDGGGPGPWILLFPLIWAGVIFGLITLLRRVRGGRCGPGRRVTSAPENSPVDLLARRFAAGEVDEEEYWMRLSVLNESKGGAS